MVLASDISVEKFTSGLLEQGIGCAVGWDEVCVEGGGGGERLGG